MSLDSQLSAVLQNFREKAPPEVTGPILTSRADFQASFQRDSAIKVGDTLPEFQLSDALGNEVTSANLLTRGPLLLTFYRGEWCPFCNLALRALQQHLAAFKAKGVTLVAISPELPDRSLTTTQKHNLEFLVLSDVGNKYAAQLGILFPQPDTLRPIFDKFGHDLKGRNGDDSMVVPVAATLLVDQKSVVRNAFIDPDYTKRLEPATALEWINALES